MVADLLPEEKRAEGFGIMRVVANLAITIGPLIGGLIATRSFMALFILDAITSTVMAIIVLAKLPETKPESAPEVEKQKPAGNNLRIPAGIKRRVVRWPSLEHKCLWSWFISR